MNFRQLRYFAAIAREGSLTKASTVLGIAQPALSRHLKLLEARLGVPLFHRVRHGMALTEAGTRLQERAEFMLRELVTIEDEIGSNAMSAAGLVVLGVPPPLSPALYAPVVARARAQYGDVKLRLLADLTYDLEEWIRGGRVDLAVLTNPKLQSWLSLTPLTQESLYLVAPLRGPRLPSSCDIANLKTRNLILTSTNDVIRIVLEAQAKRKKVALRIDAEIESIEATKQLVCEGLGSTVLPYSAIYREVARKEVQIGRLRDLSVTHFLAERTDRPKSRAISLIAEIVTSEMGNLRKQKIIR